MTWTLMEMTWTDVFRSVLNKMILFTKPDNNKIFEKSGTTVNSKTLKNPSITKGILKSSKTKHTLYDKILKSETCQHEISYKNYRKLFKSIKQGAKSRYYSKMILHDKDNIKKLGKSWRKWLAKANLSKTHYQNNSFSII